MKLHASRAARPARQRGVALITAIFIVALAVIAATALATSSAIAIHRTEDLQDSEAAWWYADGVESWVKSVLQRDAEIPGGKKADSLADPWAQPVSYIPVDNGGIRGQVIDLQGRFNLNNLWVPPQNGQTHVNLQDPNSPQAQAILQFNRLLENIPNLDPTTTEGLSDAIIDWIDPDNERHGIGGFEDGDYLGLVPAYRAANQPFQSVSELLAVHGITPKIYEALRPYVCALPLTPPATGSPPLPGATNAAIAPQPTPINVNTAPAPVLLSIAPDMSSSGVMSFIDTRNKEPVQNTGNFWKAVGGQQPKGANIAVTTNWFELHAEVVVGSARVALYSVIYRPSGTAPIPRVVAHSTDTD